MPSMRRKKPSKSRFKCLSCLVKSMLSCVIVGALLLSILGMMLLWTADSEEGTKSSILVAQDLPKASMEKRANRLQEKDKDAFEKPPLFVTVVMPSVVNPPGREKRLKSITDTWGPSSHALYVLHDTDKPLRNLSSQNHTSFPQPLVIPSSIPSSDGIGRLRHVIEKVLHHPSHPQFAFFVNDHTYVLPHHLCHYLADKSKDPTQNLYLGHAMKNGREILFNSGAAGYVLSRAAMEHLVQKWQSHHPECVVPPSTARNYKFLQGNPGLLTAQCLQKALQCPAVDTRDVTHGKSHIFHAFGLVRLVTSKVDQWYINKHDGMKFPKQTPLDKEKGLLEPAEDVKALLPLGVNCCSPWTVSFHYVEHAETRALYQLQHRLAVSSAEASDMSKEELGRLVRSVWPPRMELGHYAHALPEETDPKWDDVLTVVKKIFSPDGKESLREECRTLLDV